MSIESASKQLDLIYNKVRDRTEGSLPADLMYSEPYTIHKAGEAISTPYVLNNKYMTGGNQVNQVISINYYRKVQEITTPTTTTSEDCSIFVKSNSPQSVVGVPTLVNGNTQFNLAPYLIDYSFPLLLFMNGNKLSEISYNINASKNTLLIYEDLQDEEFEIHFYSKRIFEMNLLGES